jgi:2-methylisocitrate lyase-like PEP mutase family enzyme
VLDAGAVGVNLEDSHHGGPAPLRPVEEQAERLSAARQAADGAGVRLFLNARVDTYLWAVGEPAGRLAETLRRAAAYVAAGADGIFVPGVVDPAVISALVAELPVPLNVLVGRGAPPVAELAALGVARISVGAGLAVAAYDLARRAARALLTEGTYPAATDGLTSRELNALMSGA